MSDRDITPPTFARQKGVNVHRVLAWIASGELAAVNVGDGPMRPRWRISAAAIDEFERRRAATPAPKATKRRQAKTTYTDYFG